MPEKCDCGKNKEGYIKSGLDGKLEQPLAPGNYPAAQDEATIVIMPLGVAANAS